AAGTAAVYLPHFADGGGWRTQIVLVNPTDSAVSGTIQFFGQGDGTTTAGTAVTITANNTTATSFTYNIPKKSSFKLATAGPLSATVVGSVRVPPTTGAAPSSLVVFSFRQGGITVSEAGVPATQGNAFRMYVEENNSAAVAGAVQTGVALANLGAAAATV